MGDIQILGTPSSGIPIGGTTGQALVKASDTDLDAEWDTPAGSVPIGGATGQTLVKASNTDFDTEWDTPAGGSTSFISSNKWSTE